MNEHETYAWQGGPLLHGSYSLIRLLGCSQHFHVGGELLRALKSTDAFAFSGYETRNMKAYDIFWFTTPKVHTGLSVYSTILLSPK